MKTSDSLLNGVRPPNLPTTKEGTYVPLSLVTPLLENKTMKRAKSRLEYYGDRSI